MLERGSYEKSLRANLEVHYIKGGNTMKKVAMYNNALHMNYDACFNAHLSP